MLTKKERSRLNVAMLSDVLDALSKTREIDQIVLVSRDKSVAKFGRTNRLCVLPEGRSRGLNPAVRKGIQFAEHEGAHQVLVVPSDVPLAKPIDFTRIVKAAHENEVVIIPSYDEGGTNALLLCPPGIMPVSYGRNSFKRHCRLARKRRLRFTILKPQSLRLDLDNPSDLSKVRSARGSSRTQGLLRILNS